METRTGDDLYDISGFMGGDDQYVGVIWDAGGNDTISIQGTQRDGVVDLRQGGFSAYGRFFDFFTSQFINMDDQLGVAFEVDIENGIGGGFNDTMFGNGLANTLSGNGGDDEIWGAGGTDLLRGNAGNDTFHYRLGDGNDVINELAGGGRDRIELGSFPTLDSFTSDLSFRRLGRDLVIELALDGGLAESTLTITNQSFGGYRVETMQFNGVDIDLNSVFSQSTSASKRFAVSATSSSFGFLVTPV
jgi:Ca2+-binding RTX toxin-like protein